MPGVDAEAVRVDWLEQSLADVPADDDWLTEAEVSALNRLLVPKRRSEWRLGRWTAKLAVSTRMGVAPIPSSLRLYEVRRLPSGAPEIVHRSLPMDVTISLTHRAGRAACALASFGTALGCDLELAEPRSGAFVRDYFSDSEQAWLAPELARGSFWLATLLWSAKESALKALSAGLTIDSRELLVSIDSLGADQREDASWRTVSVAYQDQIFSGWWQHSDGFLRTVVASPAALLPEVVEPSVSRSVSLG